MESTIRLFRALPIESKATKTNDQLMKQTLGMGFIFTPEVIANYPDTARLIEIVNQSYGRSPKELNQTFHKSWAKVRDASIAQLVTEQIIHYFTTYGMENMDIYDQDSVYIPNGQLDVPEIKEGIHIVVIRGYTKDELKEKLMGLLSSGVALSELTITDALDVATFVGVNHSDLDRVTNREAKSALYDLLGTVPADPIEFLRFIVYRATNKTLLIKNKGLINELKGRDNLDIVRYFDVYGKDIGLQSLANIFYRYKPIFLAFRTNTKLKKNINKIRRLAKTYHQPMAEDILNNITSRLKSKEPLTTKQFYGALDNANIFRKIRLAYALKFRTTDADSILYRIRNGKSYAKEFNFTNKKGAQTILDVVMKSIVKSIAPNVNGKKIFIPEGIRYALPATEKQFTGNLPTGTYVELAKDMVIGIHWENQPPHRIDLYLSITSNLGKIGWDGVYRDNGQGILFSGDMTDAPKPDGATELFYISERAQGIYIMFINYYNFDPDVEVPFKILVAHQKPVDPRVHYTIDPNNIVALSNTSIKVRQKSLGIIVADDKGSKFYFAESELGSRISVGKADYVAQARKYLLSYYTDSIILNDVLIVAGAELVDSVSEADINLSPETIDKMSILSLLGTQ